MLKSVTDSKGVLVGLGYSEMAIDDFWETFVDEVKGLPAVLQSAGGDVEAAVEKLELKFREEGGPAEYMVWYCRALAAGHLKQHSDRFLPFVMDSGHMDMASFCSAEVEPMGRECEQVQIIALCESLALPAPIAIEYLDGSPLGDGGRVQRIELGGPQEDSAPPGAEQPPYLTLLYRPGHYDILYGRE